MNVVRTSPPGLVIIEPNVLGDTRGFLMESCQRPRRGIFRGLHLRHPDDHGEPCSVFEGEVFDVVVDVRVGPPTFAQPSEIGVLWNEPDIRIEWPVGEPKSSEKDAKNLRLKDVAQEVLPGYA